jgi:thioredoxin reductase (NADPH)
MAITSPTIEARRGQMFPVLSAADMARLERFGTDRAWAKGSSIVKAGETAPGLVFLRQGSIRVSQGDGAGARQTIIDHGPGQFLGELAQLSDRPALVDAEALEDVEAVVLPGKALRDVLVQEAELGERLMRALILRRVGLLESGVAGPVIIGPAGHADVLRLDNFLTRNGYPHRVLDSATDGCAATLVARFRVAEEQLPIVLCLGGQLLHNPGERELARCIGMAREIDSEKIYDTLIVGAGPAGLACAVYAASEGLSTLVLDCRSFGGQAGASARIENYLGFPTGITGIALMARAYNQAQKFGAEIAIPDQAAKLDIARDGDAFRLHLGDNEVARARTVVLASGARYRRLSVPDLGEYEGACVHYWASPIETQLCDGQEVALCGAGNSAGQATVFLAGKAKKVWMIVRGASLEATMSQYLVDRIRALPNVEVLLRTEICGLEGAEGTLKRVRVKNRDSGAEESCAIGHVFSFIGADPNTDWLADAQVKLDAKGFVITGEDGRHPLETCRDGVFAVGDVRAGSVKRVAAAVGEGSGVVSAIHAWLAKQREEMAAAQ